MTFKDKVYQITNKIPLGKVATYGQIAKLAEGMLFHKDKVDLKHSQWKAS